MDFSSVTVRGRLLTASVDGKVSERIACAQTSRRLRDPEVDPRDPDTHTLLTSVLEREMHAARQSLGTILNQTGLPETLKDDLITELSREEVEPSQRLSSVQAGRISERLLRESSLEPCHELPPGPVRIPEDTWKELSRAILNRPLLDAFSVKLAPYVSSAFPVTGFYRRLFSLRGYPATAPLTGLTAPVRAPAIALLYRLSFGAMPWPELVERITQHDPGLTADQLHRTFKFLEEAGLVEVDAPIPDARELIDRLSTVDHPTGQFWVAQLGALLDQRPGVVREDDGSARVPLPKVDQVVRARLRRLRWRRAVARFLQQEGLLVPLFRSIQATLNLTRHPARMNLHDFLRGLRLIGTAPNDPTGFAERCVAFDQEVWTETEVGESDLEESRGATDEGDGNGHSAGSTSDGPGDRAVDGNGANGNAEDGDESPGSRLRTQWSASGEEGWGLEDSSMRWEYGRRVLSLSQETVWEETESGRRLPIRWMPWILEYLWLCHSEQVVRLQEIVQDGIVLRPRTVLLPAQCSELRLLSPPDPDRTDSLNVLRFGSKLDQLLSLGHALRFEALPPPPGLTPDVCMADLRNPWGIRLLLRWLGERRELPLRVTRACTGQVFFMD